MFVLISTIALVHLLAVMSPGPDFFFVTRTAVSQTRACAVLGVLGIVAGIVVWSGISFLGLQALFLSMPMLQSGIAAAGGLYLMWMGFQLLQSARAQFRAAKFAEQKSENEAAEFTDVSDSAKKAEAVAKHPFLMGLFTNLSNPKAVIYFGSIFSGFVTPDVSLPVRWAIFAEVILISFLWFLFVALVFGLPQLRRAYKRAGGWIDGAAGVIFFLFGAGLVVKTLFV